MIPLGILAAANARTGGGGGGDPYWANVVSLLNFPGADGSTVFTDETGKIWTPYGNAQIDTSLGYNAGLFDGAGDYIKTVDSSDLALGSGDFCVEGIAISPDVMSQQALIEKRSAGFSSGDWVVFLTNAGIQVYSYDADPSGTPILNWNSYLTTNTIFHWAWTRDGSTMRLFIDGVQRATKTSSATIASSSTDLTIGMDVVSGGRFFLNGHVVASRITKGVARYTSSFTPPAAPFPTS